MYGAAPVGSVAIPVEVELYPDSAAMINVAGTGFEKVLVMDEEAASSAVGAGGHKLSGLGHGRADLFFPATSQLESRRAADLPCGALGSSGGAHVKLAVHADRESPRSPSKNVLLLEGPLFRVGDTPTTNGRPLGSHAEAQFSLSAAPSVFGIFGTHPLSLCRNASCGGDSVYGLRVGDIIDMGDSSGRRQRVTDIRARIATVDTGSKDIPLVSTVLPEVA
jgi:hypothetical protein